MAGNFQPTRSYSNLTPMELEQLRRGDFAAGLKATTIGDSGLAWRYSRGGASGKALGGTVAFFDTSADFNSAPTVFTGDKLTIAEGPAEGEYTVMAVYSATELRLDRVVPAQDPITYELWRPQQSVGRGSVGAERFFTWAFSTPNLLMPDVPPIPGGYLGTLLQTSDIPSEVARWYGPDHVFDGTAGVPATATSWEDNTPGINFSLYVQAGDLLLIKPNGYSTDNDYAVAQVASTTAHTLVLDHIISKHAPAYELDTADTSPHSYLIIRPSAVKLLALPGSGPRGQEQTFLFVSPASTLHTVTNPTTAQINADRLTQVIPPVYNSGSVDRADAPYAITATYTNPEKATPALLDRLGYRVVIYPDNGAGSPDLTKPITGDSPIIDPAVVAADQRMTIDYAAGIVRFSCAPVTGGEIKPSSGCVDGTTGRLNLYAVFWAYDRSLVRDAVSGLWVQRATATEAKPGAKITYNSAEDAWLMGASLGDHDFYVKALPTSEDSSGRTYFGVKKATNQNVYFVYDPSRHANGAWMLKNDGSATTGTAETEIEQKTAITVGDTSYPAKSPGDYNPAATGGFGYRDTTASIKASLLDILGGSEGTGGYGILHLRRGLYYTNSTIDVPPGVIIEGEGHNTVIKSRIVTTFSNSITTPTFRFGPNTPWGVYDSTWDSTTLKVDPLKYAFTSTHRIEGVDIVWNPVRRVWATFVADITTNSVWFNEVRLDGTSVLPGWGVNIKTSAGALFSSASPNSQFHTPGHYPRAAYHPFWNDYTVVWVEEYNGGSGIGPRVYAQTFELNPTNNAVLYKYQSDLPVAVGSGYCDHPSVAVDTSDETINYTVMISRWTYSHPTLITASSIRKTYWTVTSIPSMSEYTTTGSAKNVFSSTDIVDDGLGGWMVTWSVREHPLWVGPLGSTCQIVESAGAYLIDNATANWASDYGIAVGSRVLLLGEPAPTSAPFWTFDQEAFHRPSSTAGLVTGYGTDCVVTNVTSNPAQLRLKDPATGNAPYSSTYWQLAASAAGSGNGTTTFTDATQNFVNLGVKIGDILRTTYGGDNYATAYVITNVAATQLTLNAVFPNTGGPNATYKVWVGMTTNGYRNFKYAIAPQSYVYAQRIFPGTTPMTEVSLTGVGFSASLYSTGIAEADFVRLGRSSTGNWLVAFQTFNTTGVMARYRVLNFNEGFSTSFVDNAGLIAQDTDAPYREHVSTCSVLLSDNAQPLSPIRQEQQISTTSDCMEAAISRTLTSSTMSLGTRAPLTRRPNYVNPTITENSNYWPYATDPYGRRRAQDLNREVSAACFFHRCPSGYTPSLIPDLTWSGSDWTVVSPSKTHIHSYTGNYFVNGGFMVTLGDPSFYFGNDGTAPYDSAYLRRTIGPGDKIYFPSNGTFGTIASIHNEHCAVLSEQDSLLLAKGALTTTRNVEWVLIRGSYLDGYIYAGIKNPGFRVTADGRPIISSSYVTFADDPGDNPDFLPVQELMRRTQPDDFLRMCGNNSGANLPGIAAGIAGTEPGEDPVEEGSRYKGDIGFKGVAVGQPKGCSHRALNESPMIAVAWGENLFGTIDRVVSRYLTTDTNEVRVYRQSFGPYNNGIRNLKIEGRHVPAGTSSTYQEWQVLSRQHVFTRHGLPAGATGFFATDGFRNCFAYPKDRTFAGNINYASAGTELGEFEFSIFARYTDAVGRNPLEIEGPRPQQNWGISTTARAPLPYASDLASSSPSIGASPCWPSAPRVVWDGSRFVAAWVEGGLILQTGDITPNVLCIAALPGSEDRTLQGPELVSPSDRQTVMRSAQRAEISVQDDSASLDTQTITLDIAFSGRTYAVLWAAGLDQAAGRAGAVIGVTLFDAASFGGSGAAMGVPYITSSGGSTGNGIAQLTDAGATFLAHGVRVGDVLVVSQGSAAVDGEYTILKVFNETTLIVDRPFPSIVSVNYTLHRAIGAGAKTITLDVAMAGWDTTASNRDVFTNPKILWDGKQFVAIWREKAATTRGISCVAIPEQGFGKGLEIKTFAGGYNYGQNPQKFLADDAHSTSYLGLLEISVDPQWIDYSTTNFARYNLRLRTGDILVCTGSVYDVTDHPENAGWYAITDVDYVNHKFRCGQKQFASSAAATNAYIFGAILGADVSDPSYGNSSHATNSVPTLGGGAGPLPTLLMQSPDTLMIQQRIERVLGFVYNEMDDEYATLFVSLSAGTYYLYLGAFNRQTMRFRTVKQVASSVSNAFRVGSLAWNGRTYMATWAIDTTGTQDVSYASFNAALQQEDTGTVAAFTSTIGNGIGLVPGPLYGTYNASGTCRAKVRNIQSVWNSRLNRWVVAVSYFWHSGNARSGSPTTYTLESGLQNGATISSWNTNGAMLLGGGPSINDYQPGMKLIFNRTSTGVYSWLEGYTTIMSTSGGNTIFTDIRPSPAWLDALTSERFDPTNVAPWGAVADTLILSREDVFVFTLGFDSPAIQFLDADNCSLDNVILSGALDIEERYARMAAPTWQGNGRLTGIPSATGATTYYAKLASTHRNHQYNHLLMTPAGKVETPQLVNVKSMSKIRYGHGTPVTSTTDRGTLKDRNWRK